MPKNTSKNKPEPKNEKKAAGTSSIRFGNIELSNVDLQSIVKESEDLQKNPEFMKSLNQFALEKSKEIVNAAEISSEIKKKPASPPKKAEEAVTVQMNFAKTAPTSNAQKVQKNAKVQKNVAPPPPPPSAKANKKSVMKSQKHLVNPNGQDTAYYQLPVDCESCDFDPNLGVYPPTHMPRFEISKQFFQKPKVIAEQLLSGQFPFTFPFKIDVFFGLTGCIRQCTYFYSGQNTWDVISTAFRHKYCESEIYQWFYMNYAGEMMEITDTLSLVQMLITHGASPKGAFETVPDVGKVLCVSRSRYTENQIFERESDLILGMIFTDETFTKQSSQFAEYLPYQLAPNSRYAEYYEKMLSTEGKREPYDGYFVIGDLVMKCQRRLDLSDLFKDPRSKTVTNNDLQALLVNSFKNPYKNCSPVESMQLEFAAILSELKKSKHQTVMAYDYIERQLKDQIRKIIRESR